jgi:hypothetical protein
VLHAAPVEPLEDLPGAEPWLSERFKRFLEGGAFEFLQGGSGHGMCCLINHLAFKTDCSWRPADGTVLAAAPAPC